MRMVVGVLPIILDIVRPPKLLVVVAPLVGQALARLQAAEALGLLPDRTEAVRGQSDNRGCIRLHSFPILQRNFIRVNGA